MTDRVDTILPEQKTEDQEIENLVVTLTVEIEMIPGIDPPIENLTIQGIVPRYLNHNITRTTETLAENPAHLLETIDHQPQIIGQRTIDQTIITEVHLHMQAIKITIKMTDQEHQQDTQTEVQSLISFKTDVVMTKETDHHQ